MLYKLRPYKKDFEYSYAFGIFPVNELIKYFPETVDQVIFADSHIKDAKIIEIQNLCKKNHIEFTVNTKKIKLLASKGNTFVIAVFKKQNKKLDNKKDHIVLVSPTNLGNLGMILRTMILFGLNDIAIIKPAIDIYDPKVIASSVGGFFQINVEYFNSLEEYTKKYNRKFFTFVLDEDSTDIRKVDFVNSFSDENISLVFGNEANGLSKFDSALGTKVHIPQTKNLDSLNLANAISIAVWEVYRNKI